MQLGKDPAGNSTTHVPEWFRSLCLRLGMSTQAPDGWAVYHRKPHAACLCCLLATFAAPAIITPFYILASKPYRCFHHGATAVYAVAYLTTFGVIWRGGPLAADTWLAKASIGVSICTNVPVSLAMMLGPKENCIFQDRLAVTFLNAVFLWLTTCAAVCGNWAPDRPKTPYRCD